MNGMELAASKQKTLDARAGRGSSLPAPAPAEPTLADQAHDKARALVVTYNRRIEEIRKDDTLSDKGRKQAMQDAYDEATLKVRGVQLTGSTDVHQRTQDLRQTLFGLTPSASDSAVVAHRDAQDRVAQVSKPDDLGELMERAHASGDAGLVKAGFAEAYRRSKDAVKGHQWEGLVSEYAANHPDKQSALNELEALTTKHAKTAALVRRTETSVMKPREIR